MICHKKSEFRQKAAKNENFDKKIVVQKRISIKGRRRNANIAKRLRIMANFGKKSRISSNGDRQNLILSEGCRKKYEFWRRVAKITLISLKSRGKCKFWQRIQHQKQISIKSRKKGVNFEEKLQISTNGRTKEENFVKEPQWESEFC